MTAPLTEHQLRSIRDHVRATREVLRRNGVSRMGDVLDDDVIAAHRPARPTVALLGERGVGKSTLLDAILFDLADGGPTTTNVRVVPPTPSGATPRSGPLSDATIRVTSSPVVRYVEWVDTPGHESAVATHDRDLELVRAVDAVIFVIDPATPLDAATLDLVVALRARTESVLVVMTRIDSYRGWRQVLDHDEELVRQRAELTGCRVLPAGGALGRRAVTAPAAAEGLVRESRVADVVSWVQCVVAKRVDDLRAVNTLRLAVSAAHEARAALVAERSASSGAGRAPSPALADAQRQLKAIGRDSARSSSQLEREFRALALDHGELLRRGLQILQRRYGELARTARRRDIEAIPDQMFGEVRALLGALGHEVDRRLQALTSTMLGELDDHSDLAQALRRAADHELTHGSDLRADAAPRARGLSERLATVSSFSSGRSLATSASGTFAGLFAAVPLGLTALPLGVGVAFAAVSAHGRLTLQAQQEMRGWVREQLQAVQVDCSNAFARHLHEVQSELKARVSDAAQARQEELGDLVEHLRRADEDDRATGQRTSAELTERIRAVSEHGDRGRKLLAAVSTTSTTTATHPTTKGPRS